MGTRQDIYQQVTDAILAQLDAGTAPWRQPWVSLRAMSVSTNKPYRGLNTLLLAIAHEKRGYSSPFWGTYRKLSEMGGQVRRGERSSLVTFWKLFEVKDDTTATTKRVPFLRGYSVFNVEQCEWPDGIPERLRPTERTNDPIAEAQSVANGYIAHGPKLFHSGDIACYRPAIDVVSMPERDQFSSSEAYYAVLFHELTHSTGHPSRLDRDGITEAAPFGSPVYSREELVAELGSAMVAATVGIQSPELLTNAAAYIDGWRRALTDDPKAVAWAAGRAQRAADLILGQEYPQDPDALGSEATTDTGSRRETKAKWRRCPGRGARVIFSCRAKSGVLNRDTRDRIHRRRLSERHKAVPLGQRARQHLKPRPRERRRGSSGPHSKVTLGVSFMIGSDRCGLHRCELAKGPLWRARSVRMRASIA